MGGVLQVRVLWQGFNDSFYERAFTSELQVGFCEFLWQSFYNRVLQVRVFTAGLLRETFYGSFYEREYEMAFTRVYS